MFKKEKISGWANFPVIESEVARPGSIAAVRDILLKKNKLIARGNARSYGDASLSETTISTRKLNKLLDFDQQTGLLTCQSGILLSEILEWSLPRGWFFMVAPGTKFITVGGAIAADVHGKNHETDGSFSRWLDSFQLVLEDGSLVKCSRSENAGLFWKTIGGMGFTGIIVEAAFKLRPISSLKMRQTTQKVASLDALFDLFEKENPPHYQAAWVDCLDKNGRAVLFSAEHFVADADDIAREGLRPETLCQQVSDLPNPGQKKPQVRDLPTKRFGSQTLTSIAASVVRRLPIKLLNSLTINVFNKIIWLKEQPGEGEVPIGKYFFPLDAVDGWNHFYGKNGFIQYQFAMPATTIRQGIQHVLEAVRASDESPFLVVLKKFGDQPAEAFNSFPMRGYSFAMDFPMSKNLPILLKKLDAILLENGGKIYLAKDAGSDPRLSGLKSENFPENRFESLLRRRIFPKT